MPCAKRTRSALRYTAGYFIFWISPTSTNYLLLLGEDAFTESSLRLKTKLELNTPIRTTKLLVKLGSGTVLVLALGVERIVKEL
jgi:hypothetical protein